MPRTNNICECGRVAGANTSGGRRICDRCFEFDNRVGSRRHSPTRYDSRPSAAGDFYNYAGAHTIRSGGMTMRRMNGA